MSLQIKNLFPSAVGYSDNYIDSNLLSVSLEYLEKYGSSNSFNCPCISTVNTIFNILEEPPFQELKEIIRNRISEYCDAIDVYDMCKITNSWINLYESGGYQDLHIHHNSVLSGVIYLQSEGKEDFVAQSSSYFFQPIPLLSDFTEGEYHHAFPSPVGRCYIFPSHLLHKTLPATSRRISLSFNLRYK